jgi:hypothetical protein
MNESMALLAFAAGRCSKTFSLVRTTKNAERIKWFGR